jgi:hypothetical protein
MGEAQRRGPHAPDERDKLPDFIFGRDRTAERAGGFLLAGRLVTPFPKREKPSESESAEIAALIERLMGEVKRDPLLQEAGIWRGDVKPPHGMKPPFPDDAMIARMNRCAVVVVRIDPRNDGLIPIDDTLMADIMGRH